MRLACRYCVMVLLVLAAGVASAQPAPAADQPVPTAPKPAILFVPEIPDVKVQKALDAAGLVWSVSGEGTQGGGTEKIVPPLLPKFNVVVLTTYPQVGTQGPTAEQQTYMQALRQYVEQGGGLYLCGGNNQDTGMCVRFQQELLKPWGASVLREFVSDRANVFNAHSTYTWTSAITRDPLTEGVSGLFYPMMTGWGGTSYTNPAQVDRTWKVLVRGMPTAYTCALYDSKPREDKAATYAASPPLLAVKQVGKGRVVLWPTLATCTLIDGYHYLWDDGLMLEGKVGERSSQGLTLCLNLLKWAVEPSVKAGKPGGYVPGPPKPRTLDYEPGFVGYKWDTEQVPEGLPKVYKALIGARTALSSGKGSVADYAAEARKAGYSYLVITEDLEKMTQAKWDQLVAQCKAAAGLDLLVDPGFKFYDENGNQGVVWGQIGFPKDEWMSDKVPGRIKAVWHWTHGFQYWPPVAIITTKANPKKAWFLGKTKGFAAFTYANGKLIDEDVNQYLEMMRLRFDNWVCAVHLLEAPAMVAQAAKAGNMQTYVRANQLADVPGHMSGTYGTPVLWYWPVFVSDGPMIDQFGALNPGTTDLAVTDNDRYRLRVGASSPAGLKEVRLWDGPRLMRRFAVTGNAYDQSLDFWHDRQRCWVAEVTDQAGGRAISWGRWAEVQEQWFTNCGDNWNFMDGGKWRSTAVTDTRGLEAHISPASVDWGYANITAEKDGKTYSLAGARPCVFVDKVMVSRFCSLVDYRIEGTYEPTASANWNDFAQREAITPHTTHSINTRCTFYTNRPDEPQIRMVECTVAVKQPVTLAKGEPIITTTCYSGSRPPYDHIFVCDASGMDLCEIRPPDLQKERSFNGKLAAGGYVSIFPGAGGLVGVFALDGGLTYKSWFGPGTANFWTLAGEGGKTYPAGSGFGYKQLVVMGRRFSEPSNREMEWIRTGLGLQGKPGYSVEPSAGEVTGTQYVLQVKASQGGFRAKFSQASLPEDLPLRVEGLNDRWDAGVWYVGRVPMWRAEWTVNEYGQLVAVMRERYLQDPVYWGPVQDGVGYFGVDTERSAREVFAGNLLVCDRPELYLHAIDLRAGKRQVEVHNAGEQAIRATVKPAPGFTLLGQWEKAVEVPAGSSVVLKVE